MKKQLSAFLTSLAKVAVQYGIITTFLGGIFYGIWWAIAPRVKTESSEIITALIEPELEKRDAKILKDHDEVIYMAFVMALSDTTFLNKIKVIVEETAEKVVDKKLTSVMKREMVLKIKEMAKDTIFVINPMTGETIGYDLYHFYNGGVLKLEKKRF